MWWKYAQENTYLLFKAGTDEEQDDEAQGSSTAEKSSVSLLEQIVRSHPIWYLQHVGRSGAVHLLRPMEEGVCTSAFLFF